MDKENLIIKVVEDLKELGLGVTREIIDEKKVISVKLTEDICASIDEDQIYEKSVECHIPEDKIAVILLQKMLDDSTREKELSRTTDFNSFNIKLQNKIKSMPGVHSLKETGMTLIVSIVDNLAQMNVDLQSAYLKLKDGIPYEAVEQFICSLINDNIEKAVRHIKMDAAEQVLHNKEELCKRILYRPLENTNDKMSESVPKIRIYDMVFYPCIDIRCNIDHYKSEGSLVITNKDIAYHNLTKEDLYELAINNAKKLHVNYTAAGSFVADGNQGKPIFERLRADNIAQTERCLSIFSSENILTKLLYKPFFDNVGASFQEPYFLIINNDYLMTAYPESEISLMDIREKIGLYRERHNTAPSCKKIIFYYKNGMVNTYDESIKYM